MKIVFGTLFALMTIMSAPALVAETCLLCGSGSTNGCQQCRGSRDACKAKGCKVSGTGSCSTAANVKICRADGPVTELTYLVPARSWSVK